ncbi:hypothetical protein GXP71_02875 [Cellulomonas sp. H30R-01]|jgi:hypothetical protein|uniref:hypothetical protein n=1 Tax=Cellulomonas sp. H30R-01 TaxID=2704467 RepID=UPI00138CB5AB|nr:hypothetical protein [Cellulomonas sp. H30R-01]QHT55136.1 hypothetical protein GXP71_02875 [Cellulomonas sp. H30R-01]
MPKTADASVDWHMFIVGHDIGEPYLDDPVDEHGVIGRVKRTYCTVVTGIATGCVRVTTEALDGPPESVDDTWEDVGEVSLETSTELPMRAAGVDPTPGQEPLDPLDAHGPGWYRLRVHARGRDSYWDGSTLEVLEHYLILSWPAPYAPPATLRATSEVGLGRPA